MKKFKKLILLFLLFILFSILAVPLLVSCSGSPPGVGLEDIINSLFPNP
jgi:hypothetical protein